MKRGISIVQFKLEYETTRNKLQRNPVALIKHSKWCGRNQSTTLIGSKCGVLVVIVSRYGVLFDAVIDAAGSVFQPFSDGAFGGQFDSVLNELAACKESLAETRT